MRPYYIVTLEELQDSEGVNYNGENLNITNLGLLFKKFIIVGKILNRMEENDRKILKIGDDNKEFYFIIGQYFGGNQESIWDIPLNSLIIISASQSFKERSGVSERQIYTENFRIITELEYNYYYYSALKFLSERIRMVSRIISSGITELKEMVAITGSQYLAEGIFYRIKENKGFDIAMYEEMLSNISSNEQKSTREIVLDLIRSRGEISLKETVDSLKDKISENEIEEIIYQLLSSGEILEIRTGRYKYVS